MFMAVMQIGIVRMFVHKPSMPVQMNVRLTDRIARRMRMLVMRVMEMAVLVFQGLVHMLVVVRFCQMQINADPHQQRRAEERNGQWLAE